jgi:nitroreductase
MMKFNDLSSVLAFLKTRKSASAKTMGEPGPNGKELADILEMAVRVPDHGKLSPWRFIVFTGESRAKVGEKFGDVWRRNHPDHGEDTVDFQRKLFLRAPVIVAVISCAKQHPKIPIWEQQMSAAAVCFNLELTAQAGGFDVQWQTDWIAYDPAAKAEMGVRADEAVAGIIYIGTSTAALEDRPRPDAKTLTNYWS